MISDCHIHVALGDKTIANLEKKLLYDQLNKILQNYIKLEIHALRDGGDKWGIGKIFRDISKDLPIIYQTPIHGIYKKGLYGDFLGSSVFDGKDGIKKIDQLKKESADFIKIILTGIMSFDEFGLSGPMGFSRKELKMMVDHAHDNGLKTMVHVNSKEAIMMAIEVGVDTIEHGYGIDTDCLEAISESNIFWIPTLSPFGNISRSAKRSRMSQYREISEKYFSEHQRMVKKANLIGVKIALGSDSGASLVPLGQGTLDEMNYLLECGLSLEKLEKNAAQIIG